MGRLIIVVLALIFTATAAYAEDRIIGWDNGQCDVFDYSEIDGHFVELPLPQDWERTFTQSLQFFGKSYGEVGNLRATAVVLGPQTSSTGQTEDDPNGMVIYTRKQFRIADYVTPEGGWVTIPLEAVELAPGSMAGVFTYSNDERGLMICLDTPGGESSHSCSLKPAAMSSSRELVQFRDDGRDWMIRLTVRPTHEVQVQTSSGDLTGSDFSYYDDGIADGFITMQKYGPVLRVQNSSKRKVERVWVYAYVDGDWFNTQRKAAMYLMDSRYAIVSHGQLPYSRYTDQPGWSYVSFDGVSVPQEFLIVLEPFSRPGIELMLGYDSSSANRMSEFGSVGHAELGWPIDIPEETTNWMIRVEYE